MYDISPKLIISQETNTWNQIVIKLSSTVYVVNEDIHRLTGVLRCSCNVR